jgi:hypothetical protein
MFTRTPTPQERRELAAAAMMDERIVQKAYATPERVRASTLARLTRAALEVGLPVPPEPGIDPSQAAPLGVSDLGFAASGTSGAAGLLYGASAEDGGPDGR